MMASIPVSAIIPCYRCCDTIDRAVASIAAQTQPPSEVILVDDCSGDDTLAALYRLQNSYPQGWIKVVVLTANGGAGSARNAGWAMASQPYIAFLDADDVWHPQKLAIQYRVMCAKPDAVLSGHRYGLPKADEALPVISRHSEIRKIEGFSLLIKNRFSTPTVMLKRNIVCRFVEGKRFGEDYDLWLQIVLGGGDALFIDAPLTYLYKAPYGVSGLSAQLWSMEKGELEAYANLYRTHKISGLMLGALYSWSFAKYLIRIIVVARRSFINDWSQLSFSR